MLGLQGLPIFRTKYFLTQPMFVDFKYSNTYDLGLCIYRDRGIQSIIHSGFSVHGSKDLDKSL